MKRLFFRVRLALLYPLGIGAGFYYRFAKKYFPDHGAWLRYEIPRLLGSLVLKMFRMKFDIQGGQYLECANKGKTVFFTNHNSRLDPYVLFAILPVSYKSFWSTRAHVISEGISMVKLYGELFDLFFLHDKNDARRTAKEFRSAREYIKRGGVLSFFPEGRFSLTGLPSDFGVACTRLAIETNAQIIPILIHGTEEYYETAAASPRKRVKVTVCEPIATDEYSKKDAVAVSSLLEQTMKNVYVKNNKIEIPELVDADFVRPDS